ncbi:S-layer homology domain-containing protein [Chlorogloeopsis sp. ULAP01]|uniref:fasciclin domain-containing protein n=1 Tax=Chlorogloeopsis sp. ULAP01 TaxID=3056483 RepID=UPI0025AA3C81|nr:S-layer homology domain-containing protein [Chlorogloeopsis sp. ULAP01]MDM9382758.1 S-layer homology domain-containing protein [Chlorogloeopsis sp. ULAP01]
MRSLFGLSLTSTALLAVGVSAAPIVISAPSLAQVPTQTPDQVPTQTPDQVPAPAAVNFPDVQADYWALPFIQGLAARNIIAGFPDGTFRPEQAVTRAEFAAMIQRAFSQSLVRQLPPGGFKDVPPGFWAAPAIQEAYESGFMAGYPNNLFLPNQQIPKVQAIAAIANGLNLTPTDSAENILASNFTDAGQIPTYAINQVAAATQANLVVNYPDIKTLSPDRALTRAEAAAHLYQALVRLGQVPAIPTNVAAANYIVGGPGSTQQATTDILSLAESSNNFTTLLSLVRTAGLEEALKQPGPYTLFAPTDQAFAALPPETLQRLQQPENKETLLRILRYHVVPNQVTPNEITSGELQTLEERTVNVKVDPASNQVAVNDATVQASVQASNGVVYAVDRVLVPPNVSLDPEQEVETARRGRNYVAVGGNIGFGGNTALGSGNFAVTSKFSVFNNFSIRPGAIIGDDTVFLVPITYDFAFRGVDNPVGGGSFPISPYVGAGVSIGTGDNSDVSFLLTGGLDYPLSRQFTVNAAVNAAFVDGADVGLLLGIGYNF